MTHFHQIFIFQVLLTVKSEKERSKKKSSEPQTNLLTTLTEHILSFISKTIVLNTPNLHEIQVKLASTASKLFVNQLLPKVYRQVDAQSISQLILTGANNKLRNPGIACLRDYLLIAVTTKKYQKRLSGQWLKEFHKSLFKPVMAMLTADNSEKESERNQQSTVLQKYISHLISTDYYNQITKKQDFMLDQNFLVTAKSIWKACKENGELKFLQKLTIYVTNIATQYLDDSGLVEFSRLLTDMIETSSRQTSSQQICDTQSRNDTDFHKSYGFLQSPHPCVENLRHRDTISSDSSTMYLHFDSRCATSYETDALSILPAGSPLSSSAKLACFGGNSFDAEMVENNWPAKVCLEIL